MSDKLEGMIHGMEHGSDLIVNDMQRQFGQPRLTCTDCGRSQFGSWSSLKSGWPKCCGYTMRIITGNEPEETK